MKRRVQRAHDNKHALRIISATHRLSLDHYNILLDASFLRAVVMAFMQEEGQLMREWNSGGGSGGAGPPGEESKVTSFRFNAQVNPFAYLKGLVEESFGVAGSAGGEQSTENRYSDANTAKKKNKGTQLHFYYLPESVTALHRLIQHQQQAENRQKKFKTSKIEEAVRYIVAHLRRVHFTAAEGDSPAAGAGETRHDAKAKGRTAAPQQQRNEAKTIAAFLASVAAFSPSVQQPQQPQPGQGLLRADGGGGTAVGLNTFQAFKNAHHFFVATQSHDVRRLLPSSAACLRLSLHPNCVYLEVRGQAFHYPEDNTAAAEGSAVVPRDESFKRSRSSGSASSPLPGQRSRAPRRGDGAPRTPADKVLCTSRMAPSLSASPTVSAADVAFMRHLGVRVNHLPAAARKRERGGDGGKPKGKEEGSGGGTSASGKRDVSAAPPSPPSSSPSPQRRRGGRGHKGGGAAHPNPLSNKKKQKREVFRL